MNEERRPVQSAEPSHGAHGPDELVVSSGISLRFWRLYAQAWLVCLLFPILELVQLHPEPLHLLVAVAGVVTFVICYTWVMWSHPMHIAVRGQAQLRRAAFLVADLTILVFILSVSYGSAFLWLIIGVGAIAGVTLPLWIAFWTVMALTLLTLVASVVLSGGIAAADWLHIIPLVLLVRGLGLDMIGLTRLSSALREVHAARGELARYAVMEERLRVARDLHDLLGHTLSLIVLKSELARRVAEQDPQRAAQEIHEVERVARQSLLEVREAVAGYRQPVLESELDGARQLFDAAGIECTIEHTIGKLPPVIDAVLAWTVREGVTNIIRHSRAHHCNIRVLYESGSARVEIINDGNCRRERTTSEQLGSGLAGLTERVSVCGGRIEAGPLRPLPGGESYGFRLLVKLPLSEQTIRGRVHLS
jgi:two-component system, NarL family, sensor histidine kinase DesK